MIVVCEPQCNDGAHEMCNAGFLILLCKTFPQKKIFFIAAPSHVEAVKRCLGQVNISFENIIFSPVDIPTVDFSLQCFFQTYSFYKKIFELLTLKNIKHCVFLSSHTVNLLVLKLLQKKRCSQVSFVVFVHSILEYACRSFLWGITKKREIRWLQYFKYALLLGSNSHIQYVVLSPFIQKQLSKNAEFSKLPVTALLHPLVIDVKSEIFTHDNVRLGIIGSGDSANNARIIDTLLKEKNCTNYTLKYFSRGVPENTLYAAKNVQPIYDAEFIPRERISKEMQNIDILLYCYPKNSYQYAQSGAFFEIFQYNNPAIFLDNEHFIFFNESGLPIGRSVHTFNEMADLLAKVVNKQESTIMEFLTFQKNIQIRRREIELSQIETCQYLFKT